MTGEEADRIELKSDPGMPSKRIAWRQKLSDKAKQEEPFRSYSLYSLVCHPEPLKWAWTLVRRNNGAAGGDGMNCKRIEQGEGGVERFLQELEEELKSKTCRVALAKRVYIEKPDAGTLHVRFDEGEGRRRSLALSLSIRGDLSTLPLFAVKSSFGISDWGLGCLGIWVVGYLGSWVFGFLGIWVFGYLGSWVFG